MESLELRNGCLGSLRLLPQGPSSLPWVTGAEAIRLAVAAAEARATFVARTMRGRAAAIQDVIFSPAIESPPGDSGADALQQLSPYASHTREAVCGDLCPVAWSARRELVPVKDSSAHRLLSVIFRTTVYRCGSVADRDAFVAHPTRYTSLLVHRQLQPSPPCLRQL